MTIGDVRAEQGHHVATIRHGKSDVRRQVKVVVEAWRAITEYLEAAGRAGAKFDAPLFVQFKKGDKPTEQGLSGISIGEVVKSYAAAAG